MISLKHAFTSAKTDGGDSTRVRPSNWNAEHVLTMATARILGRTTAGTGAVEELDKAAMRTFVGGMGDFIVSKTASASATLDFTEFNASLYDSYVFKIKDLRTTTNSAGLILRASVDGGASYAAGGADYNFIQRSADQSGTPIISEAGGTSSGYNINGATSSSGCRFSGTLDVLPTSFSTVYTVAGLNFASSLFRFESSGSSAANANAVRFLATSGNLTSGTITMYGLRNA
jgi:hypothetical protein